MQTERHHEAYGFYLLLITQAKVICSVEFEAHPEYCNFKKWPCNKQEYVYAYNQLEKLKERNGIKQQKHLYKQTKRCKLTSRTSICKEEEPWKTVLESSEQYTPPAKLSKWYSPHPSCLLTSKSNSQATQDKKFSKLHIRI